jgi:hypothetical protein
MRLTLERVAAVLREQGLEEYVGAVLDALTRDPQRCGSRRSGRLAALRVPCPYCLAGPGEACEGKRGPRWAVHRDRLGQATADNVVTFPRRP